MEEEISQDLTVVHFSRKSMGPLCLQLEARIYFLEKECHASYLGSDMTEYGHQSLDVLYLQISKLGLRSIDNSKVSSNKLAVRTFTVCRHTCYCCDHVGM